MRNYGISAIKLNKSGTGVAEVFLHRYTREKAGSIGLQRGRPVKYAEVADLIARGDNVSVVRMSARCRHLEAADPVRLERGLQSHRGGLPTAALMDLPRYD